MSGGSAGHVAKCERSTNSQIDDEETRAHAIVSRNERLSGRRIQIKVTKFCVLKVGGIGLCGCERRTLGEQSITVCIAPGNDIKRPAQREHDEWIQVQFKFGNQDCTSDKKVSVRD